MRQDTRDEAIGHATGTAAGEGVVSITGQPGHVGIELRFWLRAPGRTRTCDPLLRRQLLYPTELRAPGTTLCMPKVTCRPQAGWLSVAAEGPPTSARRDTPARRTGARLARARPGRYPACPANSSISRSRTRPKPAESSAAHAGQPSRSNHSPHWQFISGKAYPHADVPYPVPHCGNSHMVKMPSRGAEVAHVIAVIDTVHSYCQRMIKGLQHPVGMASYSGR